MHFNSNGLQKTALSAAVAMLRVSFKRHSVDLGFREREEPSGRLYYLSPQRAAGCWRPGRAQGANEVTKPLFYKATTTEKPALCVAFEAEQSFFKGR